MSDLKTIKERIYDEDRIEEVLEALGCKNIHIEGDRYVASRPNGDNKRSIQVDITENLYSSIRTKGISGDIYAVVAHIQFDCESNDECINCLTESKMWLINELGYQDLLEIGAKKKKKTDYNAWLKDLKKKRAKTIDVDSIKPNRIRSESILRSYCMLPYQSWVDEGINHETQTEFEVGFDWDSKRIITIVRNIKGDIIGVKGRSMEEDTDQKYIYVERMNKSIELFGLHKTKKYIDEKKEIILFEGYKSVFKAWERGIKNVASFEGDDISPQQVSIIKSLGIDISIVICYDKDKPESEILAQVSKFKNRRVFYTFDDGKLLKGKQSPIDAGIKTWNRLYENKVEYKIKA